MDLMQGERIDLFIKAIIFILDSFAIETFSASNKIYKVNKFISNKNNYFIKNKKVFLDNYSYLLDSIRP